MLVELFLKRFLIESCRNLVLQKLRIDVPNKLFDLQTTQVGEVLRALNTNPTEAEVKRLVQDQKADGRISFETFLPILQAVSSKKLTDTVEDFIGNILFYVKLLLHYKNLDQFHEKSFTLSQKFPPNYKKV